ncbi:Bis(5'-nucleosyl)-tetraphosphatase PrpE [Geobacillus sp. BCO2]|nr:Bis(5'-nucleosyl)-tetraphosphatase PrpE [Geobacillus sp. BCO2]
MQIAHGLETTVAEYRALPPSEQEMIRRKFIRLYEQAPLYAVLDEGRLVIAHAGIRHDYIGRTDKKVKTFVLYGTSPAKRTRTGRRFAATGRNGITAAHGLYTATRRSKNRGLSGGRSTSTPAAYSAVR